MAENSVASKPNLREFVVEFGDPCCRQITINTLMLTVRGSWSMEKLHAREPRGPDTPRGCRSANQDFAGMPPIPGMRLKVVPRTKTAVLYDPLENDPRLLARIQSAAERAHLKGTQRWIANERVEHKLTDHKFKSLLRDLVMLRDECEALKVVDGEMPTPEQIDELPGEYEYDPWSNSPGKPKFRSQVDEWQRSLEKQL